MIVYNITIKVSPAIEAKWIDWMKHVHIPEIMETGYFVDYKIFSLLQQDDSEGKTFVVQYFAKSIGDYNSYIEKHAPNLRAKSIEKWGDQFIAFRTLMEAVQ